MYALLLVQLTRRFIPSKAATTTVFRGSSANLRRTRERFSVARNTSTDVRRSGGGSRERAERFRRGGNRGEGTVETGWLALALSFFREFDGAIRERGFESTGARAATQPGVIPSAENI